MFITITGSEADPLLDCLIH